MNISLFKTTLTSDELAARQRMLIQMLYMVDFGRDEGAYGRATQLINASVGQQFSILPKPIDARSRKHFQKCQTDAPSKKQLMGGYAEKFIHHSNCELFPEFASEYFGDNVLQNLGFLVINCPHNAAGTPHNGYTVRGAYDQAQYNVALYNWCIFVSHVFRAECGAALSDVNYYSRRQLCAGKMLAYANMLGDAKLQQYSMLVMA